MNIRRDFTSVEGVQPAAPERRPDLAHILLSRQSCGLLEEPGPDGEDLDLILDAGLRAPDHGRLRPWRFVLIRGAARAVFAELLVAAQLRRDQNTQDAMLERLRTRVLGIPLLIAVGTKLKPESPIPEIEQLLAAGAAAMNMLTMMHVLGYAGIWVTGPNSYDRGVNDALGLGWPDRLVGMLFVGTRQASLRNAAPPPRAEHVLEWTGPMQP